MTVRHRYELSRRLHRAKGAWCFALTLLLSSVAHAASWPELSGEAASSDDGHNDAALIVAIERYAEVPKVQGAIRNADDWYRYLTRTRKVPSTNVRIPRSNSTERASSVGVSQMI